MSSDPSSRSFVTTRWSRVVAAGAEGPEGRRALSELCGTYYPPVLRFLEKEVGNTDAARDLAHQFFEQVLSGAGVRNARPGQGRFRSYLLGALRHFRSDHWDHHRRLKRGGGVVPESLDQDPAASETAEALELPDPRSTDPDLVFDRTWALTLMDCGLKSLEAEYVADGKTRQFETLKVWLMGEIPAMSQAESGKSLGLSEGAVKVVIHRMRKRFREIIRQEIAHTVGDMENVDEELRYLVKVLAEG